MYRYVLLCVCLMMAPWVWSNDAASTQAARTLKQRLDSVRTLTARFTEVVFDERGNEIERRQGEMMIKKPGKFRWVVRAPYTQYVVADGQYLWQYDPDLEQATVRNQREAMSGTAAEILAGNTATLTRDFTISSHRDEEATVYVLHARADTGFERIELYFRNDTLSKMVLFDPLGQKTFIELTSVVMNEPVADSLFFLSLPEGTEIVDSRDGRQAS